MERLDDEGFGVAKGIRIPYTLPGELVEVTSTFRKKRRRFAREFTILEASPRRVLPRCPHFGICGGCRLQHMSYEDQLAFKREKLRRILGVDVDVLPSPKTFGHRNRIDVAITPDGVGFRRFGTWWSVFDLKECSVFGPRAAEAVSALREFMADHDLKPYDLRTHEGFLRYIVLREGKNTGDLMVSLVTTAGKLPDPTDYFEADSIYHLINDTLSDVSFGEPRRFWGKEFITERLLDVQYLIHPNSFFQTNTYQAERLVSLVAEHVDGSRILDLYSGVGTFSIYLAKRGISAHGIDINEFSIELARRNAELNGVSELVSYEVKSDSDISHLSGYDTIILDPPRAGLHPRLSRRLLSDSPERILYVSCNPKTFKRDLDILSERYRLSSIVGLDMFPHTPHVELFSVLERR